MEKFEVFKVEEHSEPFDKQLKDIIIELIHNKIYEVEANGFEPKFIVLSRKSYTCLAAHLMEKGIPFTSGCDGNFPTQILGLPIIMAGDTPLDVRVLADARMEYQYEVHKT